MNLIYAALLLHSAGKEISEDNIKKIVDAVGASVEESQIKALIAALKNVNIDEVLKRAKEAPVAAAQAPAPVKEEKKEEGKKEEEEAEKRAEQAVAGLSALFG